MSGGGGDQPAPEAAAPAAPTPPEPNPGPPESPAAKKQRAKPAKKSTATGEESSAKFIPGTSIYATKSDPHARFFQKELKAWEEDERKIPKLTFYIGWLMICPNHSEGDFPSSVRNMLDNFASPDKYPDKPIYSATIHSWRSFARDLVMADDKRFIVPTPDTTESKTKIKLWGRVGNVKEVLPYAVKLVSALPKEDEISQQEEKDKNSQEIEKDKISQSGQASESSKSVTKRRLSTAGDAVKAKKVKKSGKIPVLSNDETLWATSDASPFDIVGDILDHFRVFAYNPEYTPLEQPMFASGQTRNQNTFANDKTIMRNINEVPGDMDQTFIVSTPLFQQMMVVLHTVYDKDSKLDLFSRPGKHLFTPVAEYTRDRGTLAEHIQKCFAERAQSAERRAYWKKQAMNHFDSLASSAPNLSKEIIASRGLQWENTILYYRACYEEWLDASLSVFPKMPAKEAREKEIFHTPVDMVRVAKTTVEGQPETFKCSAFFKNVMFLHNCKSDEFRKLPPPSLFPSFEVNDDFETVFQELQRQSLLEEHDRILTHVRQCYAVRKMDGETRKKWADKTVQVWEKLESDVKPEEMRKIRLLGFSYQKTVRYHKERLTNIIAWVQEPTFQPSVLLEV